MSLNKQTFRQQSIVGEEIAKVESHNEVRLLKSTITDGLKCDWSAALFCSPDGRYFYGFNLLFVFNWDDLKTREVGHLSGFLTISSPHGAFVFEKIHVKLTDDDPTIKGSCRFTHMMTSSPQCEIAYKFSFTTHPCEEVIYDRMFAASDKTDAILVVEGKKCHVNKAFLSYHSDFFRVLFSQHFAESAMSEIPIEEVSYQDFGLMISVIHPKLSFPTDKTTVKLLELADRFLVEAVTNTVEHHLLNNSNFDIHTKKSLARQYRMFDYLEQFGDEDS